MIDSSNAMFILHNVNIASIYEQLAEECCELAQASLKKSRKIRGDNPTPVSDDEIDDDIIEEYSDMVLIVELLGLCPNHSLMDIKLSRWCHRIKNKES